MAMNPREPRKWLAVGTGVGMEIRGDDLLVAVVRVRPAGVRVLASARIARFRERPAAEWGAEYARFLETCGAGHLSATVLLPREEVIVRFLSLPGVAKRDLAAAIGYQVDSLHPYPEDEVTSGWARVGDARGVLLGISRTQIIERYALLFAEAGIRVSSFTFSAAVMYSAIRILSAPSSKGFLLVQGREEGLELYGESADRPVFSTLLDLPHDRAVSLALAELRLDPDTEPASLTDLLPIPGSTPEAWDLSENALPYATALAAACPWLALPANLLPGEQRSTGSRAAYVPTAVLAGLLLLAFGALAGYESIRDRQYLDKLHSEIARWTPDAARVQEIEASGRALRARRETLREFRLRTKADLDALSEITRVLEPPVWVKNLQLTRTDLILNGLAPQAEELLAKIDGSPYFHHSQFTSNISKSEDGELFSVRVSRESGSPGGAP